MIFRKLFVLGLLLVLMLMFNATGAYYLLLLSILIVVVCLVSCLVMRLFSRKIQIECVEKDELVLKVHTFHGLPLAKMIGEITIVNPFYTTSQEATFTLMLGEQHLEKTLALNHPVMGNLQVHLKIKRLVDLLNLFSKKYSYDVTLEHLILPHPSETDDYVFQSLLNEMAHDDYEIKEYREGDSIRDLHYKMSFKMNKPLVKERLKQGSSSFRIYVDLSQDEVSVFQLFLSFMQFLLHHQGQGEIYWVSERQIFHQEVKHVDDLEPLTLAILSLPKAKTSFDLDVDLIISSKGCERKERGENG